MNKHIVLVGLPASGKTKLGTMIASHFGWDFIDLDSLIETMTGESIPALFDRGEDHFRQCEIRALSSAVDREPPTVISTGGGVVERECNRQILTGTHVIFLDVPVDVAIRRAQRSSARPLFRNNLADTMRVLARRRHDLYASVATQTVRVDDRAAQDNAALIIDTINTYVPQELT